LKKSICCMMSFFVIFSFMISTTVAAAEEVKPEKNEMYQIESGRAAVFSGGEMKTIQSEEELSVIFDQQQVHYSDGKMALKFVMNTATEHKNVDIEVKLYPSQISLFKHNTIVGKMVSINDPFDLLSFRIEKNSTSSTLLKPNLYMEGHTVLTVGVFNKNTNVTYYYQQLADELNIDEMIYGASKNLSQDGLLEEDLINIEQDYLLLKPQNHNSLLEEGLQAQHNIIGTLSSDQGEDQNNTNTIKQSLDLASNSLLYRVPDSIFKSGEINKWYNFNNTSDPAPYAYSYITFKFAGTDNRLTYIVFLDLPVNVNWGGQEFSLQLTVRDNVSVLYNVYTGDMGLFGDDNRIKVNDIALTQTSKTKDGVFNARYYTGYKTGSRIWNIAKAIISWIPYIGTAPTSYDYLTASGDTETGKWFTYPSTAKAQSNAYNGKIINEIAVQDSGLKNKNDYFLLQTKGNEIDSITWGFSFSTNYS